MNHAPFIWASYAIGTIVLVWGAVAPLVRKKAVSKNIKLFNQAREQSSDTDA